jgi:6-phosphofructokinase 1
MGFAAVNALLKGDTKKMVGLRGNSIYLTKLSEAIHQHNFKLEEDLMQMSIVLA